MFQECNIHNYSFAAFPLISNNNATYNLKPTTDLYLSLYYNFCPIIKSFVTFAEKGVNYDRPYNNIKRLKNYTLYVLTTDSSK